MGYPTAPSVGFPSYAAAKLWRRPTDRLRDVSELSLSSVEDGAHDAGPLPRQGKGPSRVGPEKPQTTAGVHVLRACLPVPAPQVELWCLNRWSQRFAAGTTSAGRRLPDRNSLLRRRGVCLRRPRFGAHSHNRDPHRKPKRTLTQYGRHAGRPQQIFCWGLPSLRRFSGSTYG